MHIPVDCFYFINNADPDLMPLSITSVLGLYCMTINLDKKQNKALSGLTSLAVTGQYKAEFLLPLLVIQKPGAPTSGSTNVSTAIWYYQGLTCSDSHAKQPKSNILTWCIELPYS